MRGGVTTEAPFVTLATCKDTMPRNSLTPRTPLIGRESMLDRLWSEVTASAQHGCRVAVVRGPAGIGKTRLLEEYASRARSLGAVVVAGRSSAVGGYPYGALADALAGYVRSSAPAAAAIRRAGAPLAGLVPALVSADDLGLAGEPGMLGVEGFVLRGQLAVAVGQHDDRLAPRLGAAEALAHVAVRLHHRGAVGQEGDAVLLDHVAELGDGDVEHGGEDHPGADDPPAPPAGRSPETGEEHGPMVAAAPARGHPGVYLVAVLKTVAGLYSGGRWPPRRP